ncbi:Rieske (2Fe-2S) protein [Tardiphaga sp.]|jgi:3-phenylpropionate/trans-cinnamate dioxygenase ferredoxin subunit|uniref:Rieske (2Fe-2S) protein n=1 Tax=Tardiphaga sp. TaxID=1926292 RepID=UPI0026012610|nr:Rieske (2Fe-2S) protein [Tardiphaga sp.]
MSDGPILADDDPARWMAVCPRDRMSERAILCVTVAGIDLLLIRDGDRFHACERACPHEQADLGLGRVADGRLHCPRHLAWFSLGDGAISPGWPSRPLRLYPIRADQGQIWIDTRALPPRR